jgi:hypothetical protein
MEVRTGRHVGAVNQKPCTPAIALVTVALQDCQPSSCVGTPPIRELRASFSAKFPVSSLNAYKLI